MDNVDRLEVSLFRVKELSVRLLPLASSFPPLSSRADLASPLRPSEQISSPCRAFHPFVLITLQRDYPRG